MYCTVLRKPHNEKTPQTLGEFAELLREFKEHGAWGEDSLSMPLQSFFAGLLFAGKV
jgi:hypothetical protein